MYNNVLKLRILDVTIWQRSHWNLGLFLFATLIQFEMSVSAAPGLRDRIPIEPPSGRWRVIKNEMSGSNLTKLHPKTYMEFNNKQCKIRRIERELVFDVKCYFSVRDGLYEIELISDGDICYHGIYDVHDNRLRVCYIPPKSKLKKPTTLETFEDDGRTLWTLEKAVTD